MGVRDPERPREERTPRPAAGTWNERTQPVSAEQVRGQASAFFGLADLVLGPPTWTPTPAVPFPRPAPRTETDPPTLG
ncbi:hypothetical protein [Cellulomonas sp. URHB0016]